MKELIKRLSHLLSDKLYIKIKYFIIFKKRLNLKEPKTYNEKLNWLKLYDRKEIYKKMVDKYEVKDYVKNTIGEEYIIPTIGIYDSFDEINFEDLPKQFVIKCTHDSGGLVVVKDKEKLDIKSAKEKINKSLKNDYYYSNREWPYKNAKRRIIIEEYIEDRKNNELLDYKFFCFNGEPKFMFIAKDRGIADTKFNFYDLQFNQMPIKQHYPNFDSNLLEKSQNFKKMIELARILSKDIPQVRVDFYDVNGKILFGELTFFHFGGVVPFEPDEWDKKIGDMLVLPPKSI